MILSVNDTFCAVSGYSRAEVIGSSHSMLNSGHHSEAFFEEVWQTIASGRIWHGEVCDRAKDGGLFWLDSTIVPFLDATGKPHNTSPSAPLPLNANVPSNGSDTTPKSWA